MYIAYDNYMFKLNDIVTHPVHGLCSIAQLNPDLDGHIVVENRDDPLKIGRCQVRIVGLHTENKTPKSPRINY
jgi:hypothetical protein